MASIYSIYTFFSISFFYFSEHTQKTGFSKFRALISEGIKGENGYEICNTYRKYCYFNMLKVISNLFSREPTVLKSLNSPLINAILIILSNDS